jgi:hypothetical protein
VEKIRLIHKSGGVYYHYQFKYLYKLTNTRKRLRVEKPRCAPGRARQKEEPGKRKRQHCSRVFCLQEESGKAGTSARKNDNFLLTIDGRQAWRISER